MVSATRNFERHGGVRDASSVPGTTVPSGFLLAGSCMNCHSQIFSRSSATRLFRSARDMPRCPIPSATIAESAFGEAPHRIIVENRQRTAEDLRVLEGFIAGQAQFAIDKNGARAAGAAIAASFVAGQIRPLAQRIERLNPALHAVITVNPNAPAEAAASDAARAAITSRGGEVITARGLVQLLGAYGPAAKEAVPVLNVELTTV